MDLDPDELAEAVAGQLLSRWGVIFRDLLTRESLAIAWRDVLWALRRLEARGVVLGGRHVAGFAGEQFALPEAVEQLRAVARSPADGVTVQLSATDPLNLTGVILPGPRIPAQHARTITLKDGVLERPEVVEMRPRNTAFSRADDCRPEPEGWRSCGLLPQQLEIVRGGKAEGLTASRGPCTPPSVPPGWARRAAPGPAASTGRKGSPRLARRPMEIVRTG